MYVPGIGGHMGIGGMDCTKAQNWTFKMDLLIPIQNHDRSTRILSYRHHVGTSKISRVVQAILS